MVELKQIKVTSILYGDNITIFPPRGYDVDYVHWNDPKELVDRLRLLIESKCVGHTGHDNEINSILEELREDGIIYKIEWEFVEIIRIVMSIDRFVRRQAVVNVRRETKRTHSAIIRV